MTTLFDDTVSRCEFSACGRYRYWLERVWDNGLPLIAWIMLNPSTADEAKNDPTIERVQRRSRRLGYGGFVVVNLFALRSTDPARLYDSDSPVSEAGDIFRNDSAILGAANLQTVVAAWGTHGTHADRANDVRSFLVDVGVTLWCLGVTKDGSPRHPLYVAYQQRLVPFTLP